MARSKGDLTRVTFSALVLFMAASIVVETTEDEATDSGDETDTDPYRDYKVATAFDRLNTLCDKVASGDEAAEKELDALRAAMDAANKGPRKKPGRKPAVDKAAIAAEVLAGFKQGKDGPPMTPEYFALLPTGSFKSAIQARIDAAVSIAKVNAMPIAAE